MFQIILLIFGFTTGFFSCLFFGLLFFTVKNLKENSKKFEKNMEKITSEIILIENIRTKKVKNNINKNEKKGLDTPINQLYEN